MFWISPRETPMINDKKVKIIREYFSLKREATEKQLATLNEQKGFAIALLLT